MAHDVFISYSNKDKTVADAICAKLEHEGVRCWYAPRDIEPGADWAGSIIDAIEQTKIMVLVFTDFSNASRQVLREVNNAVRTGAVIVPFRLTNNAPSGGMRYYLSAVHWLDAMNGPLEKNINQLCDVALSVLKETPEQADNSFVPEESEEGHASVFRESSPPDDMASGSSHATEVKPVLRDNSNKGGTGKKKWVLPVCIASVIVILSVVFGVSKIGGGKGNSQLSPPTSSIEISSSEEDPDGLGQNADAKPQLSADTDELQDETLSWPAEESSVAPSAEDIILTDNVADADNYIYQAYSQSVSIQKYFGQNDAIVTVPATIEGLPVTTIDEKCFEGHTEIEQVILPDTVSTIGYRAFHGCSKLTEINFPSVLRKVDGWAFAYCDLTEVILPSSLKTLEYGAFYSSLHLETVVVPVQVTQIGENTFRKCTRLKTVTFLASELDIHLNAFEHESGVTLIGVPGSYTEKYARATGLSFEAYQG